MMLNDILKFPSTTTENTPTIEPPTRIILQIQPDLRRNSEIKLKEKCLGITNAFFEYIIKPHNFDRDQTYIHFPSMQGRWESQVVIDYCTGEVLEGSIADNVQFCGYIVTQEKQTLIFEKARPASLKYHAQIFTETLPWRAERFRQRPINLEPSKGNELLNKQHLDRSERQQMWGNFLKYLETETEIKLRENISRGDPNDEVATPSQPIITPPHRNQPSHFRLSDIPVHLRYRPIRILLQVSNDEFPGGLRERCIIASKKFLALMLGDEYQQTVYRLIRGMDITSSEGTECCIVVDYWIGRLNMIQSPPFLALNYRGRIQDGLMKFQPTQLDNAATQASCSMFLTKIALGRKGSVTIEGVEPMGARDPHVDHLGPSPRDLTPFSQPHGNDTMSDITVSGDWVLPDCDSRSGLSSWEFISDV